jgi:predicted nucleic acid-binding protein
MILIDANPLIALADTSDQLYAQALADLKRLQRQPFFSTSTVLLEAFFAFPDWHARNRLREMVEGMQIQPVQDDRTLWNEVFRWLSKYADHHPDWTDGHLAVLCGREKRFRVWTYDDEFRRRPDGSRIPLAV